MSAAEQQSMNSELAPSSGSLESWIEELVKYQPADWEKLPEIELYMDQVINFINSRLEPLTTGRERLLSPSMVNNYVKDGVLPRPEKKKYSRSHLAMITIICSLKSVMQLPEIDDILRGLTAECGIEEQYPVFLQMHAGAVKEVAGRLSQLDTHDADARYLLALRLALESKVRRVAAARLLARPKENETDGREKDKK